MKANWPLLRQELALWRADGTPLPLWWRDDDAVAQTAQLERLARLSEELDLPVHLAVIPADAQPSLTDVTRTTAAFIPVVHGWSHHNHAPPGAKKAEFGHPRIGADAELKNALARMRKLFGADLVPAFVAPWNRLHPSFAPTLAALEYRIVSTFLARSTRFPAPGLLAVNTHIDPIDWRGSGELLAPDQIITTCVSELRARRTGQSDATEPFGYLTHHLVHTDDLWEFSRIFLTELLSGGAQPTPLSAAAKETK